MWTRSTGRSQAGRGNPCESRSGAPSHSQNFVRLGFVPTAAAPHPLDWWPTHLLGHLHLSGAHIIALIGVLAKVLPTSANTTNTTPRHCISCCISARIQQARAVLAVLAR
eukprot:6502646-Prymnesium_polylepis.1